MSTADSTEDVGDGKRPWVVIVAEGEGFAPVKRVAEEPSREEAGREVRRISAA